MFLFVSGRHVHQHSVSIQISINLGKKLLRISCIRKIALTWILTRVFAYLLSFLSQILDLIYWTVWILFWSFLNGVTLKTSNWNPTRVRQHRRFLRETGGKWTQSFRFKNCFRSTRLISFKSSTIPLCSLSEFVWVMTSPARFRI